MQSAADTPPTDQTMSRRGARPPAPPGDNNNGDPPPSSHQQRWQRPRPRPLHADVFVRHVTPANLGQELSTIRALLPSHPYVTLYAGHYGGRGDGGAALPPGVRADELPAAARYQLAKIDADAFPVSQLGIALCDAHGRLPVLPWDDRDARCVWQVGFLRDGGAGASADDSPVSLRVFAYALFASGVVSPATRGAVTWITYGGLYHLAFVLKILTGGAPLPDTMEEFLAAVRTYLGDGVFDGRYVAESLPGGVSLKGPLMHLASLLGAPAATAVRETTWHAGERSLVACQVFMRLKGLFFAWDAIDIHAGCIHGLHSPTSLS